MGKRSRALLFVLVNILVSVFATLTVLWLWEKAHPQPEMLFANPSTDLTNDPISQELMVEGESNIETTLPFINEDIDITIRTIVGAGDINVEYVEIINQGQNPADLTSWQLVDDDGQQFIFPALILNTGGAIKVFSKTGTNTVIELFWQADAPIWQPGETARLVNSAGETAASYSIP